MGPQEIRVARRLHECVFDKDHREDFHAFAEFRRLYSTNLDSHGLLLTIIDGVSRPAPLKYQTLLDVVREATGGPAAHWVVVLFHDNMVAETVSVRTAGPPWRRGYMEYFEAEEGAEQGGPSCLALVPEGFEWILWHRYDPCNNFTITFFGSSKMCEQLDRLLDEGRRASSLK